MSPLHKAIFRLGALLTEIPMTCFTEMDKNNRKIVWNHKRSRIAKAITKKTNKTGGVMLPDTTYVTKLRSWKQYGIGINTDI